MADNLKAGDKVTWSSHGGTAHGKVVKKQTSPTQIKGHKVAASQELYSKFVATSIDTPEKLAMPATAATVVAPLSPKPSRLQKPNAGGGSRRRCAPRT